MDISTLLEKFLESTGVSTDTRTIEKNNLFFALKGPNFNGNKYAHQALDKGASYLVLDEIHEPITANHPQVLLVPSALEALQLLARAYRNRFEIPFLAVGGSNGKTTTKELIQAALSPGYKVFATPGNLNNHIGLPLSLLQMPADTEIAILELGANHEGEIAALCEILNPNYGLITNIGLDHLEGFGSLEGVARANSELFYYLLRKGGKIFVNSKEEEIVRMATRFANPISYPNPGDYYQAEPLAWEFFVKLKTETGAILQSQLFGTYNFSNLVTALCVAKYFEVAEADSIQALEAYKPKNNRSEVIEANGNTILLDAYNANPSSMAKAISNFYLLSGKKKVLILGDMYELGDKSTSEHENLGKIVAGLNADIVVFFGEDIKAALKYNPQAYFFSDKFSLHNWLLDKKIQDSFVLIKGSRGVALESTLPFLTGEMST